MSGKYYFYDERIQESRDKGFNSKLFVIRKQNEDVKIHNFGVCWQIWRVWLQLHLIQKISFSKFVLNFLYGFGCMIRIKIVTCLWAIIQSFRKYSRSLLSFLILILIKNIYLMHDVPVLTETRSVHQFDSRLWSKCPWVRWSAFTDAFF